MNRFSFDARFLCNDTNLFICVYTNLCQRYRQPNLHTKILHFTEFFFRSAFDHQLHKRTKSDTISVWRAVTSQCCQSIVERMSNSQSTIVSAHARKVHVGFNNCIESWRYHLTFTGFFRCSTIFTQGFIAQLT